MALNPLWGVLLGGDLRSPSVVSVRRLERQLANLEERWRHMPTKALVLAGVLGGLVAAVGLALTVAKLF